MYELKIEAREDGAEITLMRTTRKGSRVLVPNSKVKLNKGQKVTVEHIEQALAPKAARLLWDRSPDG